MAKPGDFSNPQQAAGISVRFGDLTPTCHTPQLRSRAALMVCGAAVPWCQQSQQKNPSQVLQALLECFLGRLCLDLKWPPSLTQRMPRAGISGAAPQPWGCGAVSRRWCKLPGVRLSTLLVALEGLSHRKDIVRAEDCSGRTGCTKRDCFAVK